MRIRIIQRPAESCIDGLQMDRFVPGYQYEVGTALGSLLLSEGWAEPVWLQEPDATVPLRETDPETLPPNLTIESTRPYQSFRERRRTAADKSRRHRS